jgi:hypothetical protein
MNAIQADPAISIAPRASASSAVKSILAFAVDNLWVTIWSDPTPADDRGRASENRLKTITVMVLCPRMWEDSY